MAAEREPNGSNVNGDAAEDESAIASGSAEAAAIDAIALGTEAEEPTAASDEAEAAEVDAAVRGETKPEAEPLPAAAAPAAPIDFDEADRFAASIRPSWAEVSPISSQPPADAIGAVDGATRVIRHTARLEVLPLRKRRASAYAILLASLVGVGALLYFGISNTTVDRVARRGLTASDAEQGPHILMPAPEPTATETKLEPAQTAELEGPRPRLAAPSEPEAVVAQNEPEAQLAPPQPGESAPELDQPQEAENTAAEKTELAAVAPQAAAPEAAAPQAAAPTEVRAPEPVQPQAAEAPTPAPLAAAPSHEAAVAANDRAQEAAPVTAAAAPLAAAPVPPAPKPAALPQPTAAASAALKPLPGAAKDNPKALLSLAAYPPNTRLKIDGMIVENPYRASLPKYGKHRIEAAAPGFVPETHVLRMEADAQLMISLKRETGSDIKSDPYQAEQPRRAATTVASPTPQKRDRGAGFVSENPY